MNLVDRLTARFKKRQEDEATFNLASINRAARRKIGFRGPVDPEWIQHEATTFVPRYIRRHFTSTKAVTRRQRRHRAVIVRLVTQKGLA